MPIFNIYARETYIQRYQVEAVDLKTAIEGFNDGESEPVGIPDYSHVEDIAWIQDENFEMIPNEQWED